MSRVVASLTMKTSAITRPRTSLAAPVVACTTGMNTPSSITVTSTVAIAANEGTALRLQRAQRLAQEEADLHVSLRRRRANSRVLSRAA